MKLFLASSILIVYLSLQCNAFMTQFNRNTAALRSQQLHMAGEGFMKKAASSAAAFGLASSMALMPAIADEADAPPAPPAPVVATEKAADIPNVPPFSKKTTDLQPYSDIGRGFKMLRPFGYNEFDGAGSGYAVKFASLTDVDENIVVGSTPSSADKTSILDFGSVDSLANKLATRRGGKVVSAKARKTEGIVYYEFEFENPLDATLPRPGSGKNKPEKMVELYQLCVAKGRLWSVQATSNDKLFPAHESQYRNSLLSFVPRL
jgi:hypothetical protein